MKRHGIAVFLVQFRGRGTSGQPWEFAFGSDTDGYTAFCDFLTEHKPNVVRVGKPGDDGSYDDDRVLGVASVIQDKPSRRIDALLELGDIGTQRLIVDVVKPEQPVVYRTRPDDAMLTPYRARVYAECGRRFGVLLVQTIGGVGIRTPLQTLLFRHCVPRGLTVKITPFVDEAVFERWAKEADVREIALVRRRGSRSARRAMTDETAAHSDITINGEPAGTSRGRLVVAYRDEPSTLRRVLTAMNPWTRDSSAGPAVEISGHRPQDFDEAKVKLKDGGRTRTFDLLNKGESKFTWEIDNPEFDPNGHLTADCFAAYADEVWASVSVLLG